MARKITIEFLGEDKDLQKTLGNVEGKSSKLGGVLGKVGKVAAAGFGVAALAAGKFTADAGKLEAKQREVVTLFGETGAKAEKSLGQVQAITKKVSNEFGIAQETLTGGLYQAISAGVPKKNALEFMRVASKAATAGVTDVETAVDGITSTVNAFGLEAKDAQAISDSMFTAVKGGKTTFQEMSDSLFNIAPAAAAAGVSFQEVNAGIAALTAGGTPTSVAATQMRAALTGLQAPSEVLDKIFGELGFKNAQMAVESKGLGFALDAVKKASGGNNGELQKLLGSTEAVSAANVLAGTGAKKFADEMKAQGAAAGATDDAFKVINKSAAQQFQILKTNLTNIGLTIGEKLLPVVAAMTSWFLDKGLPALEKFGGIIQANLLPKLQQMATWIQTKLLPVLQNIGGWIGKHVLPVFQRLSTDGPSAFAKLRGAIEPVTQTIASKLRPIFEQLVATFKSKVLPTVGLIIDRFQEWRPTIEKVVGVVGKIIGKVLEFASAILGKVLPPAIKFAGFLLSKLAPAVLDVVEVLAKIIGKVIAVGAAFVGGVKDVAKFASGVTQKIGNVIQTVSEIPGKVLGALGSVGKTLYNAGSSIIQGLIDGITAKVAVLKGKLQSVTKMIPNWKGPLDKDKILLKPAGEALIEGLISGINKKKSKLETVLTKITDHIKAKQDKLATLLDNRQSVADSFRGFATSVFGADMGDEENLATAQSLVDHSGGQRARAERLGADVKALIDKGLSKGMINELIAQGQSGMDQIHLLAGGTAEQIAAVNANQAATQAALTAAGLAAADAVMGEQIAQAERDLKLADGIRDKLKELLEHQDKNTVVQLVLDGKTLHASLLKLKKNKGKKLELD